MQVGLTAEESRDLDDIENLGCLVHLAGLMDIGQDRDAEISSLIRAQDGQTPRQPRPPV